MNALAKNQTQGQIDGGLAHSPDGSAVDASPYCLPVRLAACAGGVLASACGATRNGGIAITMSSASGSDNRGEHACGDGVCAGAASVLPGVCVWLSSVARLSIRPARGSGSSGASAAASAAAIDGARLRGCAASLSLGARPLSKGAGPPSRWCGDSSSNVVVVVPALSRLRGGASPSSSCSTDGG
eukprot:353529-Chlamydomonas_euryale.AAC.17